MCQSFDTLIQACAIFIIYNGKKVSGLDYWLSHELNYEVPQIICYYVCQETSYHIKGK